MEEVSGVTFEESFQDLPIELGRLHFSFIYHSHEPSGIDEMFDS